MEIDEKVWEAFKLTEAYQTVTRGKDVYPYFYKGYLAAMKDHCRVGKCDRCGVETYKSVFRSLCHKCDDYLDERFGKAP